MNEELTSLISELREHVLYLQELGVHSLDADLANIPVSQPNVQAPARQPEYIVPDIPIVEKPGSKPNVSLPVNRVPQSGGFLTNLPKLSNMPSPSGFQKPEQSTTEIMPKKKSTEPIPTDTTVSHISQSLPKSTETLVDIQAEISPGCTRCGLCEQRTQVAHSAGNPTADLMFIGEAPGADEDEQGKPFVGRAGQLLTKIIEAIGIKREDVFIGNINRCRPPGNRQPLPDEVAACKPFLLREIAVVRPKVIVVLGNTACQNLLETKVGITKLRGNFLDYFGVKVMPTFHPAYLLRDPNKKREVWEDMKKVRDYLASQD